MGREPIALGVESSTDLREASALELRAAQGRDGEHVIKVPVGEHHGYGLQPVLPDQLSDTGYCIHSRVDDHALGAGRGGHQVTVGLPRPGGK